MDNVVNLAAMGEVRAMNNAQVIDCFSLPAFAPSASAANAVKPDRFIDETADFIAITVHNSLPPTKSLNAPNQHVFFWAKNSMHSTTLSCSASIISLKFFSFASNIGVCATSSDIWIWTLQENENTLWCNVISKLPIDTDLKNPVFNFSFCMDPLIGYPNILVLRMYEVSLLNTAEIIKNAVSGKPSEDKIIASQFLQLKPNTAASFINPAMLLPRACDISMNGTFAFQLDQTGLAAYVAGAVQQWGGTQGEPVCSLRFLRHDDPRGGSSSIMNSATSPSSISTLMVSSANFVYEWRLSGSFAPTLFRRMHLNASVLSFSPLGDRIVVVSGNEVTVVANVGESVDALAVKRFVLPNDVSRSTCMTVSYSAEKMEYALFLASQSLQCVRWRVDNASATTPESNNLSAILESLPTPEQLYSFHKSKVNPSSNMVEAVGSSDVNLKEALSSKNDSPHYYSSLVDQGQSTLKKSVDVFKSKVYTINTIQGLIQKRLEEDSKKLISLALEAQMSQLEEYVESLGLRAGGAPSRSTESSRQASQTDIAFNNLCLEMLRRSCSEVGEGITSGAALGCKSVIEEMLKQPGSSLLHGASGGRSVQQLSGSSQIHSMGETMVSEMNRFIEEKLNDVRMRGKEELSREREACNTLREENEQLKEIIRRLTSSRVVAEMESLRAEVQQIRAAMANKSSQGSATGSDLLEAPTTEVLLRNAVMHHRGGNAAASLQQLSMSQEPLMGLLFLRELSHEEISNLVEFPKEQVPVELWAAFITVLSKSALLIVRSPEHVLSAGFKESLPSLLESLLECIQDILTEQDILSTNQRDSFGEKEATRAMREKVQELLDASESLPNHFHQEKGGLRLALANLKVSIRQ